MTITKHRIVVLQQKMSVGSGAIYFQAPETHVRYLRPSVWFLPLIPEHESNMASFLYTFQRPWLAGKY